MQRQSVISEIIGDAYPPAVAVSPGRLRRNWIVRTATVVPSEETLGALAENLATGAHASMTDAYHAHADAAELELARPAVTLVRLDELHLVVRIEYAASEHAIGDSDAIAQWGVLQRLDAEIELADVQGVPRALWFPLRRP